MTDRNREALALKAMRDKARKSKKQTPGATRNVLQAQSRLRKRLAEERKYLKENAPDMSATDKKQYKKNIEKLSRQMEGTGKEKYSQGNLYMFGGKKSSAAQYDDAQAALERKNKRTKAGLDTPSGAGKFNKGGTVKTYSAGGVTGGADMKVIAKEKETHTKYNVKPSTDYGKKKKKKIVKKIVRKNAGGMIKAYKKGGSVDGVALRGRTKVKRVKG